MIRFWYISLVRESPFKSCMRSYIEMDSSSSSLIYVPTLCGREAKAQMSLCGRTVPSEPSLVASRIRTKTSCADQIFRKTSSFSNIRYPQLVSIELPGLQFPRVTINKILGMLTRVASCSHTSYHDHDTTFMHQLLFQIIFRYI